MNSTARSPSSLETIGSEKVASDTESLEDFQDPFQVPGEATNVPSAVVSPTSVEDVQAIVRIANRFRIPLWPISRGKNNGYGGAAPQVRGSVMLSFRNMNKVLEINEELGYAIVEPGVSWFDLHDAIEAGGHDLVASIVDIGWGGVVSNTLEHGLTYMPYSLDQASHCGFEVVLPDGDLMRTGSGGDGRQSHVAAVQARSRADIDRAVHAVELRHRHEDGLLADAQARGLHAALAAAVGRRSDARGRRRAARTDARRHDRHAPAAVQHALHRIHAHGPLGLVRRRWADPRRDHREDRPESSASVAG